MAAAAILNLAKSVMMDHGNPCVANIYHCTKLDKKYFFYDRDVAKKRNSIGRRYIPNANFAKSEILRHGDS